MTVAPLVTLQSRTIRDNAKLDARLDHQWSETRLAHSMQCCRTFATSLPMTSELTKCQTLSAFMCAIAPRNNPPAVTMDNVAAWAADMARHDIPVQWGASTPVTDCIG